MWLIVGLGNPGDEYKGTRHNVGFDVAEMLADRAGVALSDKKFKARLARARLAGQDVVLMKPGAFMNLSGESVGPAAGFFKVETQGIVVIHDDLDLEVGRLKLKQGGGHGGHNGLRSLMEHLPDPGFIRVRFGIGRPPPQWDPADYVLSRFKPAEREEVEAAKKEAADAVEAIIRDGLRLAMNVYNRAPAKAEDEKKEEPKPAAKDKGGER
jgi:PTH1 family peptidyl-tRNA hydrolase